MKYLQTVLKELSVLRVAGGSCYIHQVLLNNLMETCLLGPLQGGSEAESNFLTMSGHGRNSRHLLPGNLSESFPNLQSQLPQKL